MTDRNHPSLPKGKTLLEEVLGASADIWSRPMTKPRYVQGGCVKCGHMGSLNAETRICMWHDREKPA